MKQLFLVYVFRFAICLPLNAQEYNGPAAIVKIMADSKLFYVLIGADVDTFRHSNETFPVLANDFYQDIRDGQIQTKKYEYGAKALSFYKLAEELYGKGKPKEAIAYYREVLNEMPHNSQVMTYIGQMFKMEKNYDEAEQWYRKAIETNYIDYMPHWFLANILVAKGDHKDALREIAIALVLNRNNPRILDFITALCSTMTLEYIDWSFDPAYSIVKDKDTIRVSYFNNDYSGYVVTKAVWLSEPGYKQKRTGSSDTNVLSSYEEIECLSNLLTTYQNAHSDFTDVKPPIAALAKAVEKQHLVEFIFFELWLKRYPHIVYQQKKEFVDKIADYVISYHIKAK